MNVEEYRFYCLEKPFVTESFPFNETALVFKVMDKMFALADLEQFEGVNLKCDPERAVELRETYNDILPGYHMNKKHWNTVNLNASVSDQMVYELIDHSYELVVRSLPKSKQKLIHGE